MTSAKRVSDLEKTLLRCPFCASEALMNSTCNGAEEYSSVSCSTVGCPGFNGFSYLQSAGTSARLWNQRPVKAITAITRADRKEIAAILFDLVKTAETVVTISDRKHDAWDAAKAAIAKAKGALQ